MCNVNAGVCGELEIHQFRKKNVIMDIIPWLGALFKPGWSVSTT